MVVFMYSSRTVITYSLQIACLTASQLCLNAADSDDPVCCLNALCAILSQPCGHATIITTIGKESLHSQCDALLDIVGLRLRILTQN